jgi:ABC-2 type transport system ATP-binding protein
MISVTNLRKEYRVHRRAPGMAAALRSVFARSYDTVRAVDGIDFTIGEGERVGFLGPNGAGKTTTLKLLSGLLHPSSGDVRVLGFEPRKRDDAFLQQIMLVLGQKQQLIWDLPPADTFELNRAIYDVPAAQYKQTLDELVTLLDLSVVMAKPTRQLSLGERMKCELAAALIHRPRVLFLDEPTIGLDVDMQVTLRTFVNEYNQRWNATLLLTSHYMDDVEAMCPRVIVVDHGKLIYDGRLEALAEKARPEKRLVLRLSKPVDAADLAKLGVIVRHEAAVAVLRVERDRVKESVGAALGSLPVVDLTVENPPLEEVMRDVFRQTEPTPP